MAPTAIENNTKHLKEISLDVKPGNQVEFESLFVKLLVV